ncbi:hypothetical protein [Halorussus litoreus]|uniref:hypothetical protein n=1 Tax=Halorussus litoreus TaxID=1710536 RepID=UPI000E23F2A3|nr:hypothetical protein [Halorussus litoreus]
MRTVANPVEGTEVRVEPAESEGITINGVPVELDNAVPVFRIDLRDGDRRTFIAEHVLSVLGLSGITAAEVTGVRTEWDFARPEHRFAYSTGSDPSTVVGHPAGLHNPVLAEALRTAETIERGSEPRRSVSEPVEYGDGAIRIRPREYGSGLLINNHYEDGVKSFEVDPQARDDEATIKEIVTSTTPFLTRRQEGLTHWIGDLVSDIGVIGGFDDLVIDSYSAGHDDTIGVSRKARDEGVVVERSG